MTKAETNQTVKPRRFDSAGWGFWLICFVVLYPIGWIVSNRYAFESEQNGALPWVAGFILAATVAGFATWILNSFLQWRVEADKERARREAKKRK